MLKLKKETLIYRIGFVKRRDFMEYILLTFPCWKQSQYNCSRERERRWDENIM